MIPIIEAAATGGRIVSIAVAAYDFVKSFFPDECPKPDGIAHKQGVSGGKGAGKGFPNSIKEQAREESQNTCVFCKTKTTKEPGTTRSEIDHAIPKSKGGDIIVLKMHKILVEPVIAKKAPKQPKSFYGFQNNE